MVLKVLHLSTHNENCGIGKYQEMFLEAMSSDDTISNEFFELSPNQIKIMKGDEYDNAFKLLKNKLKNFDILHIQHEFSFYKNDELERAVAIANNLGKKTAVTIHTSPNVAHKKAKRSGMGPRSIVHYTRQLRGEKQFYKNFVEPLKLVDMILVHNEVTKQALIERGVPENIIKKIIIPVPKISHELKTNEITDNLKIKSGDIVICTVGYLHKFKGLKESIKALIYLPDNHKLAIIGGLHPGSDDIKIYDEIADLIRDLGLIHRVYITGFVADDNKMNALIRECDVCVYPYEKKYYSNVSSAALNNAFANYMPVIAYPTESFKELNNDKIQALNLTQSFSYYELAREISNIDLVVAKDSSQKYSEIYSYDKIEKDLRAIYYSMEK